MEELRQILKSSMSQSQKQTSLVRNSENALANQPSFVKEILTRYGSFTQLSNKFSYANKNNFIANPVDCFRRDSPTLVRLDITYGKGSAASWLYDLLQGMFLFLGVNLEKFGKEQMYNLACTIAANYKTLKVAEFLLFVSRFEAGKYGRFYGDTSYAITVTDALNTFESERKYYFSEIEREMNEKKIAESKKGAISFEEYKRMRESKGEKVSDFLNELFSKKS